MTASELRDYLARYCGEGKGDALVVVCDHRENPATDGNCIGDAVFMEWKDGECHIVLQTG